MARSAGWLLIALAVHSVRSAEVQTLSPDTLKQTVFDDAQPWLVVCLGSGTGSDPIHEVVGKAAASALFPSDVRVGVLDCRAKLRSGKTAVVRLKLDDKVEPLLFVVAGGDVTQATPELLSKAAPKPTAKQPRELFPASKAHARALAAFVASAVDVRIARITNDKELRACATKPCALVLTAQDASAQQLALVEQLAKRFRHARFALLNLGRYELSLESKLPSQPTRQEPRLLLIRPTGAADTGKQLPKGARQLGARAYRGEWSANAMEAFVQESLAGEAELVKLKQAPSVRWRPAKKAEAPAGGAKQGTQAKGATTTDTAARERARRKAMDDEGESALFADGEDDADADDEGESVEELRFDEDEQPRDEL
ncbi:hypothetical protein KFE25_006048 [Diacronema lutheri]|uniref:Thioredoxin domain-containing protein n=2 Tax=Diacronema lutheri TaxID=2081491 RepID=A0A8J5XKD8_DIALT|nr:hypothetical protein KFE25_006048 [Diacronema lutheri]